MDLLEWLRATELGKIVFTMLVSMLPVVELRGGIPFGVALGLTPRVALVASLIGNMIPVPFILVYIRTIFLWMRRHIPKLNNLITRMEQRAGAKSELIHKYSLLGLFILVAIPLPGTGAWTGALVAALLNLRLRGAIPAIAAGVIVAGLIVATITFGVTSVL